MDKTRQICHFVFVLVMLFGSSLFASGVSCDRLFSNEFNQISFKNSAPLSQETTMKNLKEGALAQIRTSNPSQDHIEFFSAQVPALLSKLMIKNLETKGILAKPTMRADAKAKKILNENIDKSYEALLNEANERVHSKNVTYEWYMSFFLKSMIFSDVAARVMDFENSKESFELLNRKMDTLLGKSKVFFSDNLREIIVYATLGKEYSSLSTGAYFVRNLPDRPLIPVLFVPRSSDIIEAEKMGLQFVSFVTVRKDTVEGKKFPLKFAGLQIEQNLKQTRSFMNFENPKSKWLKLHDKISKAVQGISDLEALYAYVLRDAGLQSELSVRFETGFKVGFFSFSAHKPSEFLKAYFNAHKTEVALVANQKTVDNFLKTISKIEQEGLASRYQN